MAAYKRMDYSEARARWKEAIAEGEVSALNNLGYLLYSGLGGSVDAAGVVALWREAAAKHHPEAQWHLGQAHEAGKGVEQSLQDAYAWYRCSAAQAEADSAAGDEVAAQIAADAARSLVGLLDRLTPSDWQAAERLAKVCLPERFDAAPTH